MNKKQTKNTLKMQKNFPFEFFRNWTKLVIMPLLASEVLLHENKKHSNNKMLPLVGIELTGISF